MKSYKLKGFLLIFVLFAVSLSLAGQSLAADYAVKRGDTLHKIANKYGITVQELMSANGLNSDIVLVGQTLAIPEAGEAPAYKELAVMEDEPLVPGAINFKWAFVARKDPGGRNKLINLAEMVSNLGTEKPVITSGDKISFFVEPGQNTYVYIYLVDSRGNLELIFPTSMDENVLKSEFTAGKRTYIPGKYEWFSFDDNRGTEMFYLLASSSQLMKLEELTSVSLNAEGDRETSKQMVLNEIKGKKKLVAFRSPPEQPISFGGRMVFKIRKSCYCRIEVVGDEEPTPEPEMKPEAPPDKPAAVTPEKQPVKAEEGPAARGLEIDIAKLAVEVRGKDLYSKTIRLRHE